MLLRPPRRRARQPAAELNDLPRPPTRHILTGPGEHNAPPPAGPKQERSSLPRLAGNAASILSSDVLNRATTFALYALVARYLGTFEFGQLSLALTLFYIFQVLATAGLKTLVTREVAKDRANTGRYLFNGSVVAAAASLLSILILLVFVRLMKYSSETTSIILLLSIGLLPSALSAICESIFQAWERMHYIVCANLPVNVAKIILTFVLLTRGYGLNYTVIILMCSFIFVLCIEWIIIYISIRNLILKMEPRFLLELVRSASTFLGIDIFVAVFSSIYIVLLSKMTSETEVGLFSAVAQLLTPVMLVMQSIAVSVFPVMCRRFSNNPQNLQKITEYFITFFFSFVLPISIILYSISDYLILILYGNREFLHGSELLRIVVWSLIPAALTSVLGYELMASQHERIILSLIVIYSLVNLLIGIILIHYFGVVGAVVTALVDKIISFLGHLVPVSRLLHRVALGRLLWKPALAGICMASYLAFMAGHNVVLNVVGAGALYAGALLTMVVWAMGGPAQVKARYLRP